MGIGEQGYTRKQWSKMRAAGIVSGAYERRFENGVYGLYGTYKDKKKAQAIARRSRNAGTPARITKLTKGNRVYWDVWTLEYSLKRKRRRR